MNGFSHQSPQRRFSFCFPGILFLLLILPLFVLASCSQEAGNKEAAITGVSFEAAAAPAGVYLGFFPQQKVIILTKNGNPDSNIVNVQFDLSPGTSLVINDEAVDGSTYEFDLEHSQGFYTITLVAADGTELDYRLNLYEEAKITDVSSDYQGVEADLDSKSINIEYTSSTEEASIVLSFVLSPGATLTLDGTVEEDPTAVNIPIPSSQGEFETSETIPLIIQSVNKKESTEYQIVMTYKPLFTFSTGMEENDTLPDAHYLVGYFELNQNLENAVAYAIALPSTETAPADFAALKSKADAITHFPASYPIEAGKDQWFPLLDLAKETEYKIYLGVEYTGGTKDNLANPITQTTTSYSNAPWGILGGRNIKAYLGQTVIMPSVINAEGLIRWFKILQEIQELIIISDDYEVDTDSSHFDFDALVLGNDDAFQNEGQYHLQLDNLVSEEEATWSVDTENESTSPDHYDFELEILDN